MPNTSLAYFDRMYEQPDPWGYESSFYEQRKYALTLASLTRPTYRRIYEPGCSIGVLTEMLADRCVELVASDFHVGVLEHATRRLRGRPQVRLERLEAPEQWPPSEFDLVVISELAYYLDDASHHRLIDQTVGSLSPDGEVVLVHWRGETDYPLTGDQVHAGWRNDRRLEVAASYLEPEFRLDVLRAWTAEAT